MTETALRLQDYYPFAPETVEAVSDLADGQRAFGTDDEFFYAAGAYEPEPFTPDGYLPVRVLDIRPHEHDPAGALAVHLPMANPLDKNMRYQVATIAAANPDRRVIAIANPSGPGYNSGLLTHSQRKAVAHGDFRPVVEPLLRYFDMHGIERVQHIGYSYGAEKAVVAAVHGDQDVSRLVAIEPVSVVTRSMGGLALAFAATGKELGRYVRTNSLPTFEAARKESVGFVQYNTGLLRLSNLAIARAMTDGNFASRMDSALLAQHGMKATIAWGSESELAIDKSVSAIASDLQSTCGVERVRTIRLPGQKHALPNDLHLLAAIVLEGLRD